MRVPAGGPPAGTLFFFGRGKGACARGVGREYCLFIRIFSVIAEKKRMNWAILIVAGLFESGFAFCLGKMKDASGAAWGLWCAGFLVCLALSMALLGKAAQTLPIGTAYPVWTGIGAAGTVVLGIVFLHEPASALRLFFTAVLIASIVGLKAVSH